MTAMLEEENTPEHLLETVLRGFDLQINTREDVRFHCNCSRERFERGLILLGEKELESIAAEGKEIELTCQFCSRSYKYTPDEIERLRMIAKQPAADYNK